MASRVGACMPSNRPLGYPQDAVVISTDGRSGLALLPKRADLYMRLCQRPWIRSVYHERPSAADQRVSTYQHQGHSSEMVPHNLLRERALAKAHVSLYVLRHPWLLQKEYHLGRATPKTQAVHRSFKQA